MSVIRLNFSLSNYYEDSEIFEDYSDYFSDLKANLKKPLLFILGILGLPLLAISFILRCISIVLGGIVAGCVWIQNGDVDDSLSEFLYILLTIVKLLLYIPSIVVAILYFPYIIISYASLIFMLPYYLITKKI